MKKNLLFSFYTFISFLGKNIIECFILIILYNQHYNIKDIFLYLLIQYILSVLINFIIPKVKNIIQNKGLIIINTIFYILTYIVLFYMNKSFTKLILLATFYTIHSSIFWILRHSYVMEIYNKDNMSKSVGNLLIITEISYIISSIIGTILLDKASNTLLLIISSILLIISSYILYKIKVKEEQSKLNLNILKELDKNNIFFFIVEQFKVLALVIFPLYLFIYLKTNYKFIGLINIVTSISSIIILFIYSRVMNKKKKSYLIFVASFYALLWILKINIKIKILVLCITFLEGITSKIYQLIIARFMYALGKNYNSCDYAIATEMLFNFIRFIIISIYLIFINNIKIFLYICSIFILMSGFIKFKD